MPKTILIPTDFTVKSLNLAKISLQKALENNEKLTLILIHGYWMPSSISDLLFYSKSKLLDKLETPDFKASCKLLMGKYEQVIEKMTIDIFSGTNQNAFDNYLEANNIQEVYLSKNYKFKFKSSNSFDLTPYFSKSKLNTIEVNWEAIPSVSQESSQDELAALFFNHGQVAH
ncbi:hypothetical protein J2X69_004496 [Algoriphagus sp. 4150]|uniref:hypothetical protein n=1 Tax=Algoriphagus sp. 4150 TaxID=2817756 RepID=UPI002859809C|nr:hypothetical protein [Algoriphagus sp. 4150]MDR7132129.1 hypothetical protein [Algoriphagus sp. 4150]